MFYFLVWYHNVTCTLQEGSFVDDESYRTKTTMVKRFYLFWSFVVQLRSNLFKVGTSRSINNIGDWKLFDDSFTKHRWICKRMHLLRSTFSSSWAWFWVSRDRRAKICRRMFHRRTLRTMHKPTKRQDRERSSRQSWQDFESKIVYVWVRGILPTRDPSPHARRSKTTY